ncbi:MAG: hypothetical protein RMM31_03630 [Anaerolineae bacterium]|nr:hypothetical protein [Thermoflexales bacterium]MDW8395313.1 hypothetical protein [Anaerolineae bacterium]
MACALHGVRPVVPQRGRAARPYHVIPLCFAGFLPPVLQTRTLDRLDALLCNIVGDE